MAVVLWEVFRDARDREEEAASRIEQRWYPGCTEGRRVRVFEESCSLKDLFKMEMCPIARNDNASRFPIVFKLKTKLLQEAFGVLCDLTLPFSSLLPPSFPWFSLPCSSPRPVSGLHTCDRCLSDSLSLKGFFLSFCLGHVHSFFRLHFSPSQGSPPAWALPPQVLRSRTTSLLHLIAQM